MVQMNKLNPNITKATLSFLTVLIGLTLIPLAVKASFILLGFYIIGMMLVILSSGLFLATYFIERHIERLKGAIK